MLKGLKKWKWNVRNLHRTGAWEVGKYSLVVAGIQVRWPDNGKLTKGNKIFSEQLKNRIF